MPLPRFIDRPSALLVALLAVGAALLLPCLGSFGLWEPPDSWEPVHRRGREVETNLSRKDRERFARPRSELLLAEQARRALPGKAGAVEQGAAAPVSKDAQGTQGAATSAARARAAAAAAAARQSADPVAQLPARPPLSRMITTLGYRIFGVSEWAGRLPLVVLALVTLGLTFLLLWRLFDPWTGLLGGLVLLGLPAFVLQARQLTTEMIPLCFGLLSVGGLGLFFAPTARRPWWALCLGLLGLLGGYYGRGSVLGVVLPSLGVLLGMVAAFRLYDVGVAASGGGRPTGELPGEEIRGRAGERMLFWIGGGALLALVVGISLGAWAVLAGQGVPDYSAFLGETPLAASHVLSFHGMKENPTDLAVFDVMLKQLGYAAFPWIALGPLALVALLGWRSATAGGAGAAGGEMEEGAGGRAGDLSEAARLAAYGRLLLAGWLLSGLVVGTYWILRFGDAGYLALPALAGAVAVLIRDLGREEEEGPRRLAAAAVAIATLAILLRDFGSFPEALVSTHVHYQLQVPEGISLRWPLRMAVALFGLATVALLICRGAKPPVRFAGTPKEWLVGSGLGIGRGLGFSAEEEPTKPSRRDTLRAVAVLLALGVAGAGIGWITQRQPPLPAPMVLGFLLAPALLPLAPLVLATILDCVLHGVQVLWLVTTGSVFEEPGLLLLPRDEPEHLRFLWRRYVALHPGLVTLFAVPMIGVATLYLVRLLGRALVTIGVLVAGAPLVAAAALGRAKGWPGRRVGLLAGLGTLVVVPLALSIYLAWGLVPRLSEHYSYKAIFDTYNASRDAKRPEPLALFQVATRSPVFYTRGPLLDEGALRKRFPPKPGASPLVQYLASGWPDGSGGTIERVYAIAPAGQLGTLDRDTAAHEPRVPYYVLDNRNSFYVLLSNRLGRVKRGGRWVAEKDQNPLRKVVMDTEPRIHCPEGGQEICPRLGATLAEHSGSTEPSLEIIAAKIPRMIPAGRSFSITLYFRVLKKIQSNFKVFIHIDGMGNRVIGDHDPVQGRYLTSLWLPGRYVVDRHVVPAAATSAVSTPRGLYTIYAGLFLGERRMVVKSGPADKENRIILGRVPLGALGAGCSR